jgi:uncharacterized Zn-finger protein
MRSAPVIELQAADLTPDGEVFCPNPKADMKLWNTHPRVFLRRCVTGRAKCPYCGTEYHVQPGQALAHVHAHRLH